MYGHEMFFSHFRFFPLIPFLWMVFLMGRWFLRPARRWFLPEKKSQKLPTKSSLGKIPEELKKAGQQVLDNLDWDIRFLEKQSLEVSDPKERKKLEVNLRSKREEYFTIVERLEL